MVKKVISYFVGLFIISFFMAGIVSFAMECVPYLLLTLVLAAPFFGVVRKRKNWTSGIFSLFKVFHFREVSKTFLLVSCIVIMMVYKAMIVTFATGLLFSFGGATVLFTCWEGVRFAVKKKNSVQIVSFIQAFKNAW